ncbi:unnamed protein product [Durusdinium trenchii]|uniref:Uncharacterized protein n=1 Tax=Durusdinium trenchii TaxID=1381693 RepID=A0ABP0JNU1_9DINO
MAFMNFRRARVGAGDFSKPFAPSPKELREEVIPRMMAPGVLILTYAQVHEVNVELGGETVPTLIMTADAHAPMHYSLLSSTVQHCFYFFEHLSFSGAALCVIQRELLLRVFFDNILAKVPEDFFTKITRESVAQPGSVCVFSLHFNLVTDKVAIFLDVELRDADEPLVVYSKLRPARVIHD